MKNKIKIIYLSDPHFPKPLAPVHIDDRSHILRDIDHEGYRLVDFFKDYTKYIDLTKYLDIVLVITGDLTQNGKETGIRQCCDFLRECADNLKIPYTNVVISPGNHDIKMVHNSTEQWEMFRNFTKDFCTPFNIVDYYINGNNLLIVPINSTELREPDTNAKLSMIDNLLSYFQKSKLNLQTTSSIGTKQLNRLEMIVKTTDSKVRIAALHHHLVPVWGIDAKPFDIVLDAGRFIQKLQINGFSLVIHGHKHNHNAKLLRDLESDSYPFPMCILGSRSFGDIQGWFNEIEIVCDYIPKIIFQRYYFENGVKRDSGSALNISTLLRPDEKEKDVNFELDLKA